MINFLSSYLIGGIEDQVGVFYSHYKFQEGSISLLLPLLSNQPLLGLFYDIPAYYFDPIFYTNIYNIAQILLTSICSYYFFKAFNLKKSISIMLSIIFSLSPYTFYNLGVHPSLLTIWPILLFLSSFKVVFENSYKKNLLPAFMLIIGFLFNNYFGYFGFIIFSIFTLAHIFSLRLNFYEALIVIRKYLFIVIVAILGIGTALLPYFLYAPNLNGGASRVVTRSMEDFFYFSSRPWYYFIPSVDNPFLGKYAESTINILQNDWGYWLTTNYFVSEHSISYLGYINLAFAILGGIYLYKKKDIESKEKSFYISLAITAIALILFTMPPYFTISMYKIYTPTYLLAMYLPVFRSMARLSLLVVLIELIFTGYGYVYLKSKFKNTSIFYMLLVVIGLLSLGEFYVKLRVLHVGTAPVVYTYLKTNISDDSLLAVYPYNSTTDVLFWTKEHQKEILNKRDYVDGDFEAEEFTQELKTSNGLEKAKSMGVNYILFFRYAGGKDRILEKEFFDNSPMLTKVISYELPIEEVDSDIWLKRFFKIEDLNDSKRNHAEIYKLN